MVKESSEYIAGVQEQQTVCLEQALRICSFGAGCDAPCLGELSKLFLGWDKTEDWHKKQKKSQALH